MKERIVIVFIAIVVGLLITTAGFFLFHSTQALPKDTSIVKETISGTPQTQNTNKILLTVDEPQDESLTGTRTITVKGKTVPGNTLIVSTNQDNEVATPTSLGDFSVTVTIDAGANTIVTRSISPNGDETVDERLVTYSTEDF